MQGGLADKLYIADIAKNHGVSTDIILKQLEMGMDVEMEHTNDPSISLEIALDHLVEIPDYYTRLAKMEKEAKK